MSEQIGPFMLNGTEAQNASIRDMAKQLAGRLGDRVSDIEARFVPGDIIKERAGTTFTPRGLTRKQGHLILMHEETGHYDEDKVFAHETMHCLDDQFFTDEQRKDIEAQMQPVATHWDARDYHDRAYEAFACYGSAAIGGFKWPAYTEYYDKSVPKAGWPTLAATALKDYGPATPAPVPDPTPTDTRDQQIADLTAMNDSLGSQLDITRASLAESETARVSALGSLADAESKIAAKDQHSRDSLAI